MIISGLKGEDDSDGTMDKESTEMQESPSESRSHATAPRFKGNMQKFINDNLRYPANAKAEGTVEVRFIVEDNGTTDDVEVVKSIDPALDREAVRLCRMMRFEPARNAAGKPVESVYSQKITFRRPSTAPVVTAPSKQPAQDAKEKPQTQTQEQEQVPAAEALKRREDEKKKKEAEAERRKIERLTGQPVQSI